MPRAKSLAARRHRKVLKEVKGFSHSAGRRIRAAKEALLHAGQYAYAGRKMRKRDMRSLWIMRINAAARQHDMTYSTLMKELKAKNIELDRKMLADIAVNDSEAFTALISQVK